MQVRVETVSRLHFGFMDLCGDLGRLYGSIGVALKNFCTIIKVKENKHLFIENGNKRKILNFVKKFSQHYQIEPNVMIRVKESIPVHVGLGSGTQLALGISVALARICGINADIKELSGIMERGKRSGIGVACFETGGFIIDSGQKKLLEEDIIQPPIVTFRHDFPEKWCFVIVIPKMEAGLSGEKESEALRRVIPSKKLSEEICRLVQIKLLPSLMEEDIEEFGSALTEIDRRTGMHFEKAQDGIYGEKVAMEIIDYMLKSGAYGAGQSSWGPALYGLVKEKESKGVADHMTSFLTQNKIKGSVFVSHCTNKGAKININEEH